jgi:hypothetical protein
MKTTKPKAEKAKATRGKKEELPDRMHFIDRTSPTVRLVPIRPLLTLAAEQRPKLAAAELAALVGTLNLPKTREGAGEALRLVWECAQVLADERDDLAEHDEWRRVWEMKGEALVKLIGFDAYAETSPLPHKRFMALVNKTCRDGVVVNGEKLRGARLFRAFLFDFLSRETVATENGPESREQVVNDERVDAWLHRGETEHWPDRDFVQLIGREFAYWRDKLARENMKRTKGNLNEGEKKKSAAKRKRTLARPPGS